MGFNDDETQRTRIIVADNSFLCSLISSIVLPYFDNPGLHSYRSRNCAPDLSASVESRIIFPVGLLRCHSKAIVR